MANGLKTQKANGVYELTLREWIQLPVPATRFVLKGTSDIPANGWSGWPLFARPCPVTPRHGFVDSRLVRSGDEAREVFRLAKEADPDAEMMLAAPVKAICSAIWTPNVLTIGPDHDGATSGHGAVALRIRPELCERAKRLANKTNALPAPYLELVHGTVSGTSTARTWAVQYRGGPLQSGAADYVPDAMTVATVIKAEGDLTAWETTARELGVRVRAGERLCVDHVGGSLASHYGVHSVLNGVPCVTSHPVTVGMKLAAVKPEGGPDSWPMASVADGLAFAFADTETKPEDAIRLALFGIHESLFLAGPTGGVVAGAALGYLARLAITALAGEARHGYRFLKKKTHRKKLDRSFVYAEAYRAPLAARLRLSSYVSLFRDNNWTAGYGGKAWGRCALGTVALMDALPFLARGRRKALADALAAAHRIVNESHNNGLFLNKFTGGSIEPFNHAAEGTPEHIGACLFGLARVTRVVPSNVDASIPDMVARLKTLRKLRVPKKVGVNPDAPRVVTHAHAKLAQVCGMHEACAIIHIQASFEASPKGKTYQTANVHVASATWADADAGPHDVSYAGDSDTPYVPLKVGTADGVSVVSIGSTVLGKHAASGFDWSAANGSGFKVKAQWADDNVKESPVNSPNLTGGDTSVNPSNPKYYYAPYTAGCDCPSCKDAEVKAHANLEAELKEGDAAHFVDAGDDDETDPYYDSDDCEEND